MIDAIVLAGAANNGRLQSVSEATSEAMISICGRPMVWHVIRALLESEHVGNVVVVGPQELRELKFDEAAERRVEYLPQGESMIENLLKGVERLADRERVLVVTSDVPLLTSEAVDDFITRCKNVEADIYYPVIRKEVNEAAYPGVQRTYVTLKEGTFTGGNLALVAPGALTRGRRLIEQAYLMRKQPVKLTRLLGFRFLIKLAFRRLSVAEIEQRVADILNCRGVAVESPYPEIGVDVDKPSDLELVERKMAENVDDGRNIGPSNRSL